ncbi:MAG: polyribonucleotide nucleotidyltransferase [Candidatus Kerfeldbacteria bacterium]|nr:polyribonucleotide nucleotidyltransferase [Candidatus Kerfeldbacteria bacterium]
MVPTPQRFTTTVAGKEMTFEFGKLAGQTNGSCTVQYGGTVVLATAVLSDTIRDGIDYFPLMVDYEERLYAAGKIKGSRFIKREGRPTDEAVLTARMVDRSIRPLFDESIRNDIQVVVTVLSVDQENDADVVSLIAASAALSVSDIPWHGPVAGSRVGRVNGEWILNPSYEQREKSDLDLVVVGTDKKVVMIEAGGAQIPEDVMLQAMEFGFKQSSGIVTFIREIQAKVGRTKMSVIGTPAAPEEQQTWQAVETKVNAFLQEKLPAVFQIRGKQEHAAALEAVKTELDAMLKADNAVSKEHRAKGIGLIDEAYYREVRRLVLETGKRVDGRSIDELREVWCEVGLLPRTHGSGLFNRGETQVLSIVTLGSPGDEQVLDTMEESGKKRYMHHYNFPGFSVGEAKPVRSPGRREIGHGALAEKALEPVLPSKESFPYTIRVVSEVLSSNGSSSQASACGSSLALMDAGVPILAPVAGVAIGLITDPDNSSNYRLLTDIQGVEDHDGDMDFKVAGTSTGITAIQLDVKLHGIDFAVIGDTLAAALKARLAILERMTQIIPAPRTEMSQYAPRITAVQIDPEKIREVIGKGGETINKIIEECGGEDVLQIDIEDTGLIMVTSTNADMSKKAIDWIKNLTHDLTVGEVYDGVVTRIVTDRNTGSEIGAIVEVLPGKDGMVHISQFRNQRINRVSDVVKVGDPLKVKVMGVDKEKGRVELSHKVFDQSAPSTDPEGVQDRPRRPFNRPSHGSHGGNHRFNRQRPINDY